MCSSIFMPKHLHIEICNALYLCITILWNAFLVFLFYVLNYYIDISYVDEFYYLWFSEREYCKVFVKTRWQWSDRSEDHCSTAIQMLFEQLFKYTGFWAQWRPTELESVGSISTRIHLLKNSWDVSDAL